jgi:hypothetical protein
LRLIIQKKEQRWTAVPKLIYDKGWYAGFAVTHGVSLLATTSAVYNSYNLFAFSEL